MPREKLEIWVLELCREAMQVNAIEAEEVIQALTGGANVFCPAGYPRERLNLAGAAFLRIARL